MERRSREKVMPLEIYTDGSLKKMGQLSFGGWAFYALRDGIDFYHDSGNVTATTNQRMELMAVLKALKYAQVARHKGERVIIYSDSAYVVNCYLKEWYHTWEINGWQNSNQQDVANKDLWLEIIPFFDNFWYSFRKVEGHTGNYWNEKCDELAQKAADKSRAQWRGLK